MTIELMPFVWMIVIGIVFWSLGWLAEWWVLKRRRP
jgi:hypothetical protein